MASLPDKGRNLWGAIVVIVGLLVIAGVFGGTVWKFNNADHIVAILGLVTGVVGTIVTAFFGIQATAAAGTDAATAAAYVNPDRAAELSDRLRGVDTAPPTPATAQPSAGTAPPSPGTAPPSPETAQPAAPEQAAGWPGVSPGPAPEIDRG